MPTHRRNAPARRKTARHSPKRKQSPKHVKRSSKRKNSTRKPKRSTKLRGGRRSKALGLKKRASKRYTPHKRSSGAPKRSANDYKVGTVRTINGKRYRIVRAKAKTGKHYNRWSACPKGMSAKQCSKRRGSRLSKKKKQSGRKLKGGDAAIAQRLKLALFGGNVRLSPSLENSLVGG